MDTYVRDVPENPAIRFQRDTEAGASLNAKYAARELTEVSLEDALAFVAIYAEQG